MNIEKTVTYNKRTDKGLYIITIDYGMLENKSDHQLMLTIHEVINETLGQKQKASQEDITGLTKMQVYQSQDLSVPLHKEIEKAVDMTINNIENKYKNMESIVGELNILESENGND